MPCEGLFLLGVGIDASSYFAVRAKKNLQSYI